MRIKKVFLLFHLFLLSLSSMAYDAMGHRIIADIAYNNLSAKAKKQFDKVLGKNGLIYAATWPDEIRSDKQYDYSYKWHYQNLKDSLSIDQIEQLYKNPTAEGEHLFYAIQNMQTRLKKDKNDAEALKFLVHFMADLHQPMHLGRVEDLGANKISVQWFGKTTNLHAVWDGSITESQKMSYSEYSRYLQDSFESKKTQKQSETLIQSVSHVYALRTEVYNYGVADKNNYNYIYYFASKNNEMMYNAGIQLAKMLNSLF
ncbi:MAG: S1/P1 nuclease [Paludibacter sp.]